jgi:Viral coat protein P2 N-terminal domain
MPTKRTVNLPNVSGWIGNAVSFDAHTITIDLPVGPVYHEIWIKAHPGSGKKLIHVDGTRDGLLGEMRLKVNGKTQRTMTARELNVINVLNGPQYCSKGGLTDNTEAEICIYLAEPWRENEETQEGLAWATGDVSTFQLEIDIVAYSGAAAGITKPTAKAMISNSLVSSGNRLVDRSMGAIVKWAAVQIPVASGWNDFGQLPKRDFYQSLHIGDANLVEFEVKVDNNIIRQDTLAGNRARLIAHGMLPNPTKTATPATADADMPNSTDSTQRTMEDIVFDHDDRIGSSLAMNFNGRAVQDFNLRLNTTSTGNVKCIYQTLGAPE